MTEKERLEKLLAARGGNVQNGQMELVRNDTRECRMDDEDIDGDRMSARVSSDIPLDRAAFFGTFRETLLHSRRAVLTDRIRDGGIPLLKNHNRQGDVYGNWEKAQLETDSNGQKFLRLECDLGGTRAADEMLADIKRGFFKRLSIGWETMRETYERMEHDEELPDNEMDYRPFVHFTIREWRPLEVSAVTVPADNAAGFGRSRSIFLPTHILEKSHSKNSESDMSDNGSISKKEVAMTDERNTENLEANPPTETANEPTHLKRAARNAPPPPTETAHNDEVLDRVELFNSQAFRYHNIGATPEMMENARNGILSGEHATVRDAQEAVRAALAAAAKERTDDGLAVNVITEKSAERFDFGLALRTASMNNGRHEGFNKELMTDAVKSEMHPEARKWLHEHSVPMTSEMFKRDPGMAIAAFGRDRARAIAIGTSGDGIGSYQYMEDIIPDFVEMVQLLPMYDRFPGILSKDVRLPVQSGENSASWVDETGARGDDANDDITYSGNREWKFHEVQMPRKISTRSMDQTPALLGIVMGTMMRDLMRKVENSTLNGAGSSGEPTGILNFNGVEDIDAAEAQALVSADALGANVGKDVDFKDLLHIQRVLRESNLDQCPGNLIFVTTAAVAEAMSSKPKLSNSSTDTTLINYHAMKDAAGSSKMTTASGPSLYVSEFLPKDGTRGTKSDLHILLAMKPMALKLAFFSPPVVITDPYTQAANGQLQLRIRQAISWNYTQLVFAKRSQIEV